MNKRITRKDTGMIFATNEIWSHTRLSQEVVWNISEWAVQASLSSVQWGLSSRSVSMQRVKDMLSL